MQDHQHLHPCALPQLAVIENGKGTLLELEINSCGDLGKIGRNGSAAGHGVESVVTDGKGDLCLGRLRHDEKKKGDYRSGEERRAKSEETYGVVGAMKSLSQIFLNCRP